MGNLGKRKRGGNSPLAYKIQASTICAAATTDRIIATNHSGFFLVTVQIEAVAMATLKKEMANPILPPRRLASSVRFCAFSRQIKSSLFPAQQHAFGGGQFLELVRADVRILQTE